MQLYKGAVIVCGLIYIIIIFPTVSSELCEQYYDIDGNYRPGLNCTSHLEGPYCCGTQYNRTCCTNQKHSIYWPNNKLHSIGQSFNISAATVFFITFFCLVLIFTMSITCCCFRCCQDDLPRYSIHADDIDTDSDDENLASGGFDWDDSAHNSLKSFVDDENDTKNDKNQENIDSNEDTENATELDPLNRQTQRQDDLRSSETNKSEGTC
ncbi:uncharacterized protein [Antedon mediterranea]|uniref:uncharacterized protein n=1 Tax=Antedon mediterranea TaxID=105859 RepID=UPI003AF5E469